MIGDIVTWLGDPAHWTGPDGIWPRLWEHLGFCLLALGIATVIAVPLGAFVGHTGRGGVVLVGLANIVRALPTLGLVTFLFLIFTESKPATIIGLVVLAIPPILAGTYSGIASADERALDAATGVGMTGWQRLFQVEFPIAVPLLLGGIRNAMLQLVATTAVAAYVGLGGLGRLLLDGLAVLDYPKVVAGALFTALLAMAADLVLAGIQRIVVPYGLRVAAAVAAGRSMETKPATAEAPA
ncbi:ABC transporter permease [Sciscionella sediminilitoris]|uniref:ABC transporter permease n=1 Tax=Sciscionella sediminilitoris TaxID=1445613 RepID=UPI00068CADC1|nr:ABC transporter permease [Sciscionella sp. SE31]